MEAIVEKHGLEGGARKDVGAAERQTQPAVGVDQLAEGADELLLVQGRLGERRDVAGVEDQQRRAVDLVEADGVADGARPLPALRQGADVLGGHVQHG